MQYKIFVLNKKMDTIREIIEQLAVIFLSKILKNKKIIIFFYKIFSLN